MKTLIVTILLALTVSMHAHASSTKPARAKSSEPGWISYWWGKVNQHVNSSTGQWETDPDGVSGADIDMLEYCRKWYPRTTDVIPDRHVTITTWRERGNVNQHTATMRSFRCVQEEHQRSI